MNSRHHRLIGALILLLGLVTSHIAFAADIVISSASPASGEQATSLDVTISGTGFDNKIELIEFLLPCTGESCTGTAGGITVSKFKVRGSKKIIATINIAPDAETKSFNIAMTRGRGGKGTTFKSEEPLFTVKLPSNLVIVSCDAIMHAPLGSCTCEFSWDENGNIYGLLDDCVTSETLRLESMIRTAGSVQANGTERLSITAVLCHPNNGQDCTQVGEGNFSGSSVIENRFHRARVRYLDIRFDNAVSRGCDTGTDDIQSAVSFVLRTENPPNLDTDTPDPKTTLPQDAPDPINRNSLFFVSDIGIYSEDDPLCNGIEVIRTPEYTAKYSNTDPNVEEFPARDWKISVANNAISAGSYVQAGIVMLGMMPSESINPPVIVGNTIYEPACGTQNSAGILFGDLTFDPDRQIDGLVEGNTIDMTSNCSLEPTGVLVVGDAGGQTTAKVNKNEISGAYIGIDVDSTVVEVNFSGNTLTGDGVSNSGDTGIRSDAQCTRTKGKPNKIAGYDFAIDDGGCP